MTDDSDLSDVAEKIVEAGDLEAAVVIGTGEGVSDIGAFVDETQAHPAEPSLWMLALHIHHIRRTAHAAGGNATVDDIVTGALKRLAAAADQGGRPQ